jgi:hypothetical protein
MITKAKLTRAKDWLDCQAVDDETANAVTTALTAYECSVALLKEYDKHTSSVWIRADAVSNELRAALKGQMPKPRVED